MATRKFKIPCTAYVKFPLDSIGLEARIMPDPEQALKKCMLNE